MAGYPNAKSHGYRQLIDITKFIPAFTSRGQSPAMLRAGIAAPPNRPHAPSLNNGIFTSRSNAGAAKPK